MTWDTILGLIAMGLCFFFAWLIGGDEDEVSNAD
jgi:hypothetical protein